MKSKPKWIRDYEKMIRELDKQIAKGRHDWIVKKAKEFIANQHGAWDADADAAACEIKDEAEKLTATT